MAGARVQQWKKADVHLGSGPLWRGEHVGSKLTVVKRKDRQALVSLTHGAGEESVPKFGDTR